LSLQGLVLLGNLYVHVGNNTFFCRLANPSPNSNILRCNHRGKMLSPQALAVAVQLGLELAVAVAAAA